MTEQQGWTAPQADQAGRGAEGTAASPGQTTSPHTPAGIPHQAAPVSGAAYTAPVSGGTGPGAAPVAGQFATPPAPYAGQYGVPTTGTGYARPDQAAAPTTGYPAAGAGYGAPYAGGPAAGDRTVAVDYGQASTGHLPPRQPMPPHAPHMNAPAYSLAAGHVPGHVAHQPHRRSRVGIAIAAALAAIALSGGSAVAGGYAVTRFEPKPTSSTVSTTTASRPNSNGTTALSDVAAAVLPSVVSIRTGTAIGSGVVLTADGNILTNNHVAATANGSTVQVSFSNGKTGVATIVGTDPTHDLAVIKVQNVTGLTPIVFADSSQVKVGDTVLAVGSPLGLTGSVTAGIVSALNRTIDEGSSDGTKGASIDGALQTDAAINPGNSGGALVNSSGQLIGINTAIASATQTESGNIGVGFAIASNTAKQVANQIMGH
jgi:putative serine protease PepD